MRKGTYVAFRQSLLFIIKQLKTSSFIKCISDEHMHIYKVRCISLCPFMLSPTKHLVKWKKENSFPVQELILKHVKKKSGAIAIKCVNSSDCSDIFYHACNLWLLPSLDIRHSSFEVKLQPIPISIYIQHWQSNKCGSLFL